MRLREFSQNVAKSETATLMTILNHLHAQQGDGAKVPFSDIASFMNSAGYAFTFRQFQDLIANTPSLYNMVSAKSEKEIVLGRDNPEQTPGQPGGSSPEDVVGGMASKAASAAINK
jgi:hypothetical protein